MSMLILSGPLGMYTPTPNSSSDAPTAGACTTATWFKCYPFGSGLNIYCKACSSHPEVAKGFIALQVAADDFVSKLPLSRVADFETEDEMNQSLMMALPAGDGHRPIQESGEHANPPKNAYDGKIGPGTTKVVAFAVVNAIPLWKALLKETGKAEEDWVAQLLGAMKAIQRLSEWDAARYAPEITSMLNYVSNNMQAALVAYDKHRPPLPTVVTKEYAPVVIEKLVIKVVTDLKWKRVAYAGGGVMAAGLLGMLLWSATKKKPGEDTIDLPPGGFSPGGF